MFYKYIFMMYSCTCLLTNEEFKMEKMFEYFENLESRVSDLERKLQATQVTPTSQPLPQEPVANANADVDVNGVPWDERIHAKTKTKVKDGSWKRKRGVADSLYDSVIAEITTGQSQETAPVQTQQQTPTPPPMPGAPAAPQANVTPPPVPGMTPPPAPGATLDRKPELIALVHAMTEDKNIHINVIQGYLNCEFGLGTAINTLTPEQVEKTITNLRSYIASHDVVIAKFSVLDTISYPGAKAAPDQLMQSVGIANENQIPVADIKMLEEQATSLANQWVEYEQANGAV